MKTLLLTMALAFAACGGGGCDDGDGRCNGAVPQHCDGGRWANGTPCSAPQQCYACKSLGQARCDFPGDVDSDGCRSIGQCSSPGAGVGGLAALVLLAFAVRRRRRFVACDGS
jgi:MYXO-CTERM domain-containing protein